MASIYQDIVPPYIHASEVTSLPRKEMVSIYEATSILTLRDIREMTLAFSSPIYYQYGLPNPGSSAVDYIDQETLYIHLEHFTWGLRLPLPTVLIHLLDRQNFLFPECHFIHPCFHYSLREEGCKCYHVLL
ncbi:hypothetical protein Dimus_010495 [Dionaea muscipula]